MIGLNHYKTAITIRLVEDKLIQLYSKGVLHGTVHTCVGQEFSGIAFLNELQEKDYVISNHRCHGHYLSYNLDIEGLLSEVLGKKSGVCAGLGGSQHLCKDHFLSNGIQGGMIPVAAGIAFSQKLDNSGGITIVFIGDGTLGEGILYEVMNIISKQEIPLLIVCENNYYAQSTYYENSIAGSIKERARSFGIQTYQSDIWDLDNLFINAEKSIDYVRKTSKPCFHLVDMYRLNPHSKGDDYRSPIEIQQFKNKDPLNVYKKENPAVYDEIERDISNKLDRLVDNILSGDELDIPQYVLEDIEETTWSLVPQINCRQSVLLNNFLHTEMKHNGKIIFIGEDVKAPYGGAFKISNGLSDEYPSRVFSTPISEAAITGIANGLAIAGYRPIVEIMFGDFVTLCMDQIMNHASKFHYMYNSKINCPIILRTPMGGGRGYGPTHSQTLDKLLLTIDNILVIALNTFIHPEIIYKQILDYEIMPTIIIENKTDYMRNIGFQPIDGFVCETKTINRYPIVRICPEVSIPNVTIVSYGGAGNTVTKCIQTLFFDFDIKAEVIILSKIKPVDYSYIIRSVKTTNYLYVVEEGSSAHGLGSEIIASIVEKIPSEHLSCLRITSKAYPIPANRNLENEILISEAQIVSEISEHYNKGLYAI